MPIRPELRHFYRGAAWEATRARILARAHHQCEHCHVLDRSRGWRDRKTKQFYSASGRAWKRRAGSHKLITIHLTIAHLNHVPGDDRDENLRALCQRCHLLYDAAHHRESRGARKDLERPIIALLHELTLA